MVAVVTQPFLLIVAFQQSLLHSIRCMVPIFLTVPALTGRQTRHYVGKQRIWSISDWICLFLKTAWQWRWMFIVKRPPTCWLKRMQHWLRDTKRDGPMSEQSVIRVLRLPWMLPLFWLRNGTGPWMPTSASTVRKCLISVLVMRWDLTRGLFPVPETLSWFARIRVSGNGMVIRLTVCMLHSTKSMNRGLSKCSDRRLPAYVREIIASATRTVTVKSLPPTSYYWEVANRISQAVWRTQFLIRTCHWA